MSSDGAVVQRRHGDQDGDGKTLRWNKPVSTATEKEDGGSRSSTPKESNVLDMHRSKQISMPAHVYSKETMMELNDANQTCKLRPKVLSDEFLNSEGKWDPEMWHKSNTSRANSPVVENQL